VPALGLLTPMAGLITGIVALLTGKGRPSLSPAFLMGACSPLVAIVGFFIGLSIAMGRFEAVRARREQDGTY
jgi:sorbitol-specific phosphotransferase system component IIBC